MEVTNKVDSKDWINLVGFTGFILSCVALFQSVHTGGSIWTSLIITTVVAMVALLLWSAVHSFVAEIPVINVFWIYAGIATMYILPTLYWLS